MGRPGRPWYRKNRGLWFFTYGGQQISTGITDLNALDEAIAARQRFISERAANPAAPARGAPTASPAERRRAALAYHEAGHAMAATLLGVRVLRLAIPATGYERGAFFKDAGDTPFDSIALGGDVTKLPVGASTPAGSPSWS